MTKVMLRCRRCGVVSAQRYMRGGAAVLPPAYGRARGRAECADRRKCDRRRARKQAAQAARVQQLEEGRAEKASRRHGAQR